MAENRFKQTRSCLPCVVLGNNNNNNNNTKHFFLAHTPAGAESDLYAAAAAPSQTEVTDLNFSDHSTTSKEMVPSG